MRIVKAAVPSSQDEWEEANIREGIDSSDEHVDRFWRHGNFGIEEDADGTFEVYAIIGDEPFKIKGGLTSFEECVEYFRTQSKGKEITLDKGRVIESPLEPIEQTSDMVRDGKEPQRDEGLTTIISDALPETRDEDCILINIEIVEGMVKAVEGMIHPEDSNEDHYEDNLRVKNPHDIADLPHAEIECDSMEKSEAGYLGTVLDMNVKISPFSAAMAKMNGSKMYSIKKAEDTKLKEYSRQQAQIKRDRPKMKVKESHIKDIEVPERQPAPLEEFPSLPAEFAFYRTYNDILNRAGRDSRKPTRSARNEAALYAQRRAQGMSPQEAVKDIHNFFDWYRSSIRNTRNKNERIFIPSEDGKAQGYLMGTHDHDPSKQKKIGGERAGEYRQNEQEYRGGAGKYHYGKNSGGEYNDDQSNWMGAKALIEYLKEVQYAGLYNTIEEIDRRNDLYDQWTRTNREGGDTSAIEEELNKIHSKNLGEFDDMIRAGLIREYNMAPHSRAAWSARPEPHYARAQYVTRLDPKQYSRALELNEELANQGTLTPEQQREFLTLGAPRHKTDAYVNYMNRYYNGDHSQEVQDALETMEGKTPMRIDSSAEDLSPYPDKSIGGIWQRLDYLNDAKRLMGEPQEYDPEQGIYVPVGYTPRERSDLDARIADAERLSRIAEATGYTRLGSVADLMRKFRSGESLSPREINALISLQDFNERTEVKPEPATARNVAQASHGTHPIRDARSHGPFGENTTPARTWVPWESAPLKIGNHIPDREWDVKRGVLLGAIFDGKTAGLSEEDLSTIKQVVDYGKGAPKGWGTRSDVAKLLNNIHSGRANPMPMKPWEQSQGSNKNLLDQAEGAGLTGKDKAVARDVGRARPALFAEADDNLPQALKWTGKHIDHLRSVSGESRDALNRIFEPEYQPAPDTPDPISRIIERYEHHTRGASPGQPGTAVDSKASPVKDNAKPPSPPVADETEDTMPEITGQGTSGSPFPDSDRKSEADGVKGLASITELMEKKRSVGSRTTIGLEPASGSIHTQAPIVPLRDTWRTVHYDGPTRGNCNPYRPADNKGRRTR